MPEYICRGKRLSYLDMGRGPAILFGHSYLWDRRMWSHQIEALSTRFRCIVPDLWAHGESDVPPAIPCSLDELADDHFQLMQQLGLDRFCVVGLSIGGMWGMRLALRHPEAVDKLVLMGTDGGAEPEERRGQYLAMLAVIEDAGCVPPPIVDKIAPGFFSPATIASAPKIYAAFRDGLNAIPESRIAGIAAVGRSFVERESLLDQLPELDVPTLVVVGTDDAYRPRHESERLAAVIPGARLEIIDGAGHISTVEREDIVNPLLARFLG